MDTGKFSFANEEAGKWHHLIKLNQVYGSAFLTQNNDVSLFTDGKEMFHSLMQDIRAAEHSINIQYYIIKDDMVGHKLLT
ncbi:hypothetical protein RFZ44_17985, partial [Acinetobacter sp. 163]|nr:hypothetical protein [Acinetobacter sp. 163]